MTIREYISQKFSAFGLSEAYYHDVVVSSGLSLDDIYAAENADAVGKAMITLIEDVVFAPRLASVNESGFSMSWDFSGLGNWYLLLCKRYGVKPDADVLAQTGVSAVIDRTSKW